ncbi:ATP-binding protein [Nitrosopumilus sp. b3]|uniref:ATP-binding protein n=1 Tax=Nitrosopumilus sp. b3 TaxID=2109909 RepID=UPI0015F3C84F|nr:ATP-binding protein [Nitrosopumilus sp. b3]KAF6247111.1 ATP-binding protein [Nitrosopumilus sp. b3]
MRKFDLNIEEVLEDWEVYHAIREIIANAIDEQILTDTKEIEIKKEKNSFVIRDYGRGIKYEHLTQNENEEKISHPELVIGKFGVGLKDALATFDRHKVNIIIKSKHGDITIDKSSKHDFEDVVTLHAVISSPSEPEMIGTKVILEGCTKDDIEKAKSLFLKFSGEKVLEKTQYGEILNKESTSRIYINGIKVAEEENFLFSYNITSLTGAMRKALNRERTHVGRTAYTERVKSILLSSNDEKIAKLLVEDLEGYQKGTEHDEMKYVDVAVHACKILNTTSSVVFVTPQQLQYDTMAIDNARHDGLSVVVVPETISQKIRGEQDMSGNTMRDLGQYNIEWNESFEFKFVKPSELNSSEKEIFDKTKDIFGLIGGQPKMIKEIVISETMRREESGMEASGLWEPDKKRIVIKREQLKKMKDYAGTLLHETSHAISGAGDVSREFESELTNIIGKISAESV